MSRIVVFGAGGKAGSKAVAEAASRGHQVTAVVRDTAKYAHLAGDNVKVVSGDVTDAASIAAVVADHDAVVQAAYQPGLPVDEYFGKAAQALLDGLTEAGVERLVAVGIGTTLEVAPGVLVHDTEGFPEEGRTFSLGHMAQLEAFQASGEKVDWVVIAPPPAVLDADAEKSGKVRFGGTSVLPAEEGAPAFSYADLAVALIDEIENPKHHRVLVAVA
ncbi:NAD(P)-dependent oxidoreductase [Lentzea aerocolonigenes]|uniref:NAD(P)-dependent oxidoreductase n=1 Tax=Lentzea aerocolonigenes TaxID=68170 RepID=UPI0004C3F2D4|nr:NAD(P)H-binding protein [Lentzea aerocolonigenes]MCP2241546.1 hypothetical protein [Lentzea aerocolonigenes]